jgi:hypothetical protein
MKDFLKINWTGNKSGALLLTIFDLTMRRGDEQFTTNRAKSAVHPSPNQARASPCRARSYTLSGNSETGHNQNSDLP